MKGYEGYLSLLHAVETWVDHFNDSTANIVNPETRYEEQEKALIAICALAAPSLTETIKPADAIAIYEKVFDLAERIDPQYSRYDWQNLSLSALANFADVLENNRKKEDLTALAVLHQKVFDLAERANHEKIRLDWQTAALSKLSRGSLPGLANTEIHLKLFAHAKHLTDENSRAWHQSDALGGLERAAKAAPSNAVAIYSLMADLAEQLTGTSVKNHWQDIARTGMKATLQPG